MRVTYRYIRPCVVLYARGIGAYTTSVAAAWRTMHGWLESHNVRHLFRRGLGVFHDDPTVTSPDALRYDACIVPVQSIPDADPKAGISRQTLAGAPLLRGADAIRPSPRAGDGHEPPARQDQIPARHFRADARDFHAFRVATHGGSDIRTASAQAEFPPAG